MAQCPIWYLLTQHKFQSGPAQPIACLWSKVFDHFHLHFVNITRPAYSDWSPLASIYTIEELLQLNPGYEIQPPIGRLQTQVYWMQANFYLQLMHYYMKLLIH